MQLSSNVPYSFAGKFQQKRMTSSKDYFSTDQLRNNLKDRALRGGAFIASAQGVKFFVRMGSTVILARLLTPEDFGKVAMVVALTGMAGSFRELGLSAATIQKTNVNHIEVSNLFWINALVSLTVSIVVCALAPLIALFYNDSTLKWIAIGVSSVFFLKGISIQHRALLRRQMRFGALTVIEVFAMIFSTGLAITMAWLGLGYWALVASYIANPMALSIGAWIVCDWRPGVPKRLRESWDMISFGLDMTKYSVITNLSNAVDRVLLGKFYDASVVGLYSRAKYIIELPKGYLQMPLTMINLPALSSLQSDPSGFCNYYTRMLSFFAFINMPLMVFLIVCCDDIVLLLLGNQWTDTIILIQILALTSFIKPIVDTTGTVLVSLGKPQRFWRWGLIYAMTISLAFVVGLANGALGMTVAYTVANFVMIIPQLKYCLKDTPITVLQFFRAILLPAIASIGMGVTILVIKSVFTVPMGIMSLSAFALTAGASYLLICFVIPGGGLEMRNYFSYVKAMVKKDA